MIYVIKAVRGALAVAAMLSLLIGALGLIFAIGFGGEYERKELALFTLCACCMIAVAFFIMFSGIFDKLDDAERRLERKEQEKRALKRRRVSSSGSFDGTSASYGGTDDTCQDEDWIEFNRLHDDLDRMAEITAEYGEDWKGFDPERPSHEDPEQPSGDYADYE